MTRAATAAPHLAIAAVFLTTGLVAGTWFGRIPAVTSNLDLDKGQVGTLILFLSVGSLVAFQFIGRIVTRLGSARTTALAATGAAIALSLLALAPNGPTLGAALFVVGAAVGSTGVAMNAQAVVVQQQAGRPIMNSLHGYFTLGTLAGSALGALLAVLDVGPVPHFLAMTLIGVTAIALASRHLLPDPPSVAERPSRTGLALPPRALLPLGLLALCAGLGEGSMYDWSALYVHDELHGSESMGSLAFATFSLAMLVGRFGGDRAVTRLGNMNVVRYGGLLAAAGLLAGLLIHTVAATLVGFVCLGLGLSVLMPLLYSAGGSFPGIPSVQGVAAIATMGFLGLLAGPPLLGSIADAVSLRLALGIVVILCAAMALLAGALNVTEPTDVHSESLPELELVKGPMREASS